MFVENAAHGLRADIPAATRLRSSSRPCPTISASRAETAPALPLDSLDYDLWYSTRNSSTNVPWTRSWRSENMSTPSSRYRTGGVRDRNWTRARSPRWAGPRPVSHDARTRLSSCWRPRAPRCRRRWGPEIRASPSLAADRDRVELGAHPACLGLGFDVFAIDCEVVPRRYGVAAGYRPSIRGRSRWLSSSRSRIRTSSSSLACAFGDEPNRDLLAGFLRQPPVGRQWHGFAGARARTVRAKM